MALQGILHLSGKQTSYCFLIDCCKTYNFSIFIDTDLMRSRLNKVFEVPVKSEQGIEKSSIRTSCSNLKCDIYIKCQKDIASSITDEFT